MPGKQGFEILTCERQSPPSVISRVIASLNINLHIHTTCSKNQYIHHYSKNKIPKDRLKKAKMPKIFIKFALTSHNNRIWD
jgi:hypothetical protein